MPSPNKDEGRQDFLDRCMGDKEAREDFSDKDQRFAFCNSQWRNRNKGEGDISESDLEDGGRVNPDQACPEGMRFDPDKGRCVPTDGAARQEEEEGPFLEEEVAIATALGEAAAITADEVQPLFDEVLDEEEFSMVALDQTIEQARLLYAGTFALAAVAVTAAIGKSIDNGELVVGRNTIRGAPSKQAVLDGMVKATNFRTNEFFNTQVVPALQKQVAELFDETGALSQPDLSAVRATLDKRLRSVPYWRVVANAAASRSFHYGVLKAAQFQGRTAYVYTAVLDERTSEICQYLNGRSWFIADAVSLVERSVVSDDPDEVKRVMPWLAFSQVRTMGNAALLAAGVIIPPVHGNCRSSIRLL